MHLLDRLPCDTYLINISCYYYKGKKGEKMFRQKGKVMGKCGWYTYCGSCFLQEGSHDMPGQGEGMGVLYSLQRRPQPVT